MPLERFRAAPALAPLKDFQRRTVDYVFDRLYGDDPTRQFLVADEVGLGKTMVARGVVARTIEHLWDSTERIDIVYICSNQAIAAQNLRRLNVLDRRALTLPTRMTLIPLLLRGEAGLDANKVNFVSLTPGTTFDLRSSTGVVQERAFLYRLLCDVAPEWRRGLRNMLQVGVGKRRWYGYIADLSLEGVDERIVGRFRSEVLKNRELFDDLERICDIYTRQKHGYPWHLSGRPRNLLVARLRTELSRACVDALEPDLIIMDEFQRFRDLLHGESDARALARAMFEYSEGEGHAARTLMLSATPYKMVTLAGDEDEAGEHYKDFLETLTFLYGERGPEVAARLEGEMYAFRRLLQQLPGSQTEAVAARKAIEGSLRRVMARTERIASTVKRDSMVDESPTPVAVAAADLAHAAAVSKVAAAVGARAVIEYWKSAPYLLNFMRHYKLKDLITRASEAPSKELRDAVRAARSAMLDHDAIDRYKPLEAANGRMRALIQDVFGERQERNLWIPATLPYYGRRRTGAPLTKSLVFSAWGMVPDAIAAVLTYEAERRRGTGRSGRGYFEKSRPGLLQFSHDEHGRAGALRTLLLVYPSPTLAELADPLRVFAEHADVLSERAMRASLLDRLRPALDALREGGRPAPGPHVAEWAAPAVIDDLFGRRSAAWLEDQEGLRSLASEAGFRDHVAELEQAARQRSYSGIGDGLAGLLVDVALGSPAVCALRALRRIAPELAWDDARLLGAAAKVAWGFRTLFNQPDAVVLLRRGNDAHYWRRVLTYCAAENLQAVLDEYAHYLVDSEGLSASAPEERAAGVAEKMAAALSTRPSQIEVDDVKVIGRRLSIDKFQMRGRFAMRLADYHDEDGSAVRVGGVRDAFNSPFKPFVLATTSVGQEGLDFHPYCYRVYHWNLPSNPVDLEQREGRINRFKGHAVRLNLAECHAASVRGSGTPPDDPWQRMFDKARAEAAEEGDAGLIPYWIYDKGSVRVERRVPMLPYSREVRRLHWLKRSLAVYRLAFGQPRQDDLLNYLGTLKEGLSEQDLEKLQIRLEPKPEGS